MARHLEDGLKTARFIWLKDLVGLKKPSQAFIQNYHCFLPCEGVFEVDFVSVY